MNQNEDSAPQILSYWKCSTCIFVWIDHFEIKKPLNLEWVS